MAVLAEAISVIIRADALLRTYGGFDAFKKTVPNRTLCADGEIARVGFMVPDDVRTWIEVLAGKGLVFIDKGQARDIAVVDQQRGPTVRCDWIEFGQLSMGNDPVKRVPACRLRGSTLLQVVTPDGWQFEGSLLQTFGFVPDEHTDKSVEALGHEDGLDVYRSKLTGLKVFIGRAFGRKDG
jgi:hypothetical protein